MPFRSLLMVLAATLGAKPLATASEIARLVGIGTKSAIVFIQRLREAAQLPALPNDPEPQFVIGQPRYIDARHLSTRTWWTEAEKAALDEFVSGGYSPNEVADTLGRSPNSIAWYAKDRGIILPKAYSTLIRGPRRSAEPRIQLSYPFILKKRDEHADLLAVNALIPKGIPPEMRADICQEAMLAVFEGKITIDELKANRDRVSWFVKKFWRDNFEAAGHAVSLSGHDDDRTYDEVASSIAAQDWYRGQVAERSRFVDSYIGFQPATQVDDVYRSQVSATRRYLASKSQVMDFSEARDLVDSGFVPPPNGRSHAMEQAERRYGLRLNRSAMSEIVSRIESGHAELIERESDDVVHLNVRYSGRTLPIVYDEYAKRVITILPPHTVSQASRTNAAAPR
jgi:transposase